MVMLGPKRKRSKVHRLFGGGGPVIEPDAEMLGTLADLLARAKRGEIKGIGFFWVDGGNRVVTTWHSGCVDRHYMVSGSAQLAFRVTQAVVDG
jgi:hypothetical protein